MKKFKNVLFLVLCGVLFFTFAVGSGSNVNTSRRSGGSTGVTNTKLPTYGMNEDIYITNESGKYRVKFTKIYETSERNQFWESQADRVVVLEWEYENLTIPEDLYVSELNFKLYDKDNNKLETYPSGDTKYGGSIGQGRKAISSEAFALNNTNNYIELEFYDNSFNNKPDCKVYIEW